MSNEVTYAVALVIAGVTSGYASGLFGIGGGILRVPILLYLFASFGVGNELTMHLAAGTSLAVAVPGTIAASRAQYRSGNMDMAFLKTWIPALVLGVGVGLLAQRYAPGRILMLIFAVMLFLQSLQLLIGQDRFHFTEQTPAGPVRWLIASLIGALSVAMGVSGGAFTTPTLVAVRYPLRAALATATATALVASVIGAIGSVINGLGQPDLPRFSWGYVDLLAVAVMLPGVLLTAPLGVKTANHMSKERLTRALALFLMAVAADMAFDFFERF